MNTKLTMVTVFGIGLFFTAAVNASEAAPSVATESPVAMMIPFNGDVIVALTSSSTEERVLGALPEITKVIDNLESGAMKHAAALPYMRHFSAAIYVDEDSSDGDEKIKFPLKSASSIYALAQRIIHMEDAVLIRDFSDWLSSGFIMPSGWLNPADSKIKEFEYWLSFLETIALSHRANPAAYAHVLDSVKRLAILFKEAFFDSASRDAYESGIKARVIQIIELCSSVFGLD